MKVEIKNPCTEDWNNMKIGMISRHCDSCDKPVFDFTEMERAEIIIHLLENPNEKVCGRMNKQQFDFHEDDVPVLIKALGKKGGNASFLILSLVCLSLVACKEDIKTQAIKTPSPIQIDKNANHLGKVSYIRDTTVTRTINTKKTKPVPVAPPIPGYGWGEPSVGEIIFDPEPIYTGDIKPEIPKELTEEDTVLAYSDNMPEFPGGVEALYAFVKKNLNYPEYEKEAQIQGTVYVKFIVSTEGKVSKPRILKSVNGSYNFDKEVLRVVNLMPDWKPGVHSGQKVNVYFTMLVKFKFE